MKKSLHGNIGLSSPGCRSIMKAPGKDPLVKHSVELGYRVRYMAVSNLVSDGA